MSAQPFQRNRKPRYVAIEMTDQCNLRCTMCERLGNLEPLNRNGGYMNGALFETIVAYLEPSMTVGLGGFGEALMHARYVGMLGRVKEIGCKTITYTNGLLLDEAIAEALVRNRMDELSISIDGATEGTYREIRRADLGRLRSRIGLLADAKARHGSSLPRIVLQMVGMRNNVHECADLVRFARRTGAGAVTVIHLSCHMPQLKEQSLFREPRIWREPFAAARQAARETGIDLTLPEMGPVAFRCGGFFTDMFITWDGLVQPCGLERYVLGDLAESSLDEIWNGPAYEAYRRRWEVEGPLAVCVNCHRLTNDAKAWIDPPQPSYPIRLTYRQAQSAGT